MIEFDNCESKHESDSGKALLIYIPELDDHSTWIPKSAIHDDSEVWKEDQEGKLVIKDWFAEKKGWI
jgi:hypothetical protein